MKTSLTKLSSSFLLLSLSYSVWAKPVAQVIEVSGAVFMVSGDGKTSTLKANQHIGERSEVMVEEGASITLNDYYDVTYHLAGGSHLKIFDRSVQLKKGKTWIQSRNKRHPLALTTANGHINYLTSEFIATFDQATSRSQVLVVKGDVNVSNVLNHNLHYSVSAGSFTTMDPKVESGHPRTPTKVGLQSLNSALSEFKGIPAVMKEPRASRGIASVNEEPIKKGEIIFIKSHRMPASVRTEVKKHKADLSAVPIRFYGITKKQNTINVSNRQPASIQKIMPKTPHINAPVMKNDPAFTQSLKKHRANQPKHSKELESLIEDLKSF